MTLRHIRIFLAICASDCNATRAAERLHMTQPAVSLALRELEEHYGTLLFDRLGRRLVLTQAGCFFRDYAQHIAGLMEDMEKALRDWDRPGRLRIGASMTIGAQFMPDYVGAFLEQYPGTQIQVVVETSDRLERRLLDSSLDFALMEGIPRSAAIRTEAYMDDYLTIVCAKDGPFQPGQQLTQAEFARQPLLLREAGSGTREEFDRILSRASLAVQPVWESMSTTALLGAAAQGLGVAVLPFRMAQEALMRGELISVSVEGLDFGRHFRFAYHRDKYLTPLARRFMDLCRNRAEAEVTRADGEEKEEAAKACAF